jgi:ABC-type lipoprotein export system ATPase subunit
MDEPTATLDAKTKEKFNALVDRLKDMAVTYGMQFFINAHDEELVKHCDQVIRLTPQ